MGSLRTIYLDYNATTPLDPGVRAAMIPFLDSVFGNPSSVHHVGRQARSLLDDSRDRVSKLFRCKPSEIVFTSGGTESNNLAVLGTARLLKPKGRHLITSQVEHHAVLHPMDYLERKEGFEVTRLGVDSEGRVDPDRLLAAIRPDTVLVSIQAANNEIGTLQPVAALGALCRQRGVLFHTDAVQWMGKCPVASIADFNADLVSVCAHKFHGPKGVGLLYIRSPLLPDPLLLGGAHENERRAGTENLAAIVGLVHALEQFVPVPVFNPGHLGPLTQELRAAVQSLAPLGVTLRSPASQCLNNTVAFTVPRADSMTLMANLDLEGICASSGSACSAGSLEPSHVIRAIADPGSLGDGLVRFSLGRETARTEISWVTERLSSLIERSQLSE